MGVSRETLELIIKARDEATRDLEQTNATLGRLADTAANVGVVLGTLAAGKTALDLGQLASSAHRVEASFRGIAGTGADKMLDKLRASSQGTIADMDLMLSANRAMMLGVTKDAEQMARLLEVAAVRGQAMGLSTQQAFNDMMTGIGRASPLILDNLGIVTGGQKVYDDYAKSIGKATDALTEQEKKQALVSLVLDQGEGMTFTADGAAGWEQLSAAWGNLKVSLGELVNETLRLPEALSLAAQAISGFNDVVQDGQSRQDQATEWADHYRAALERLRDENKISAAAFAWQTASVWSMEQAVKVGVGSIADMHQQAQRLNPEMHLLAIRTRNQAGDALDGAAA
ncbi:MAG: hypothetical protein GX657_18505, partial [Chloroflexi bacterium]|nr:hypothetical protein [Chloroflexota bacterium]